MRPAVTAREQIFARCLGCGYQLQGLPEPRCPECGVDFDWNDPWTMRLPGRPNWIVRWLLKPPGRVMRTTLVAAVGAAAWGASVPGWGHDGIGLTIVLLIAWTAGIHARTLATWYVRQRGYLPRETPAELRLWRRKLARVMAICLLLVLLRPTLYLRFWVSYPSLNRTARQLLAQPFHKSPPYIGHLRGLYIVEHTRRCPHGVKLKLDSDRYGPRDQGAGFVYLEDDASVCSRFTRGWPLGGGWYASP